MSGHDVHEAADGVSGHGQPEDRDRAFNAGFDAFLVKPVEPEQLQRALTRRR